ncbi:heterokaryon incompatibility protein-domain-containing protein [Xylariaceae sp. FL1651]|nr:heterokaryon incompatibility protein-domain-containing protein [Xylariaceae sp. FL1651]
MRLINTGTLELEEIHGTTPEYAILSHTWGDDEVTLQEFVECSAKTKGKQGYAKITATCRQARLDNIDYCWIDTCCIDKTSSAELSEAINSMFVWYKHTKSVASRIAKCRWFTRGWCLQELIAPNELRFYDLNWRLFADKNSMKTALSKITGIDAEVLEDTDCLLSSPVARRMSWASKRQIERAFVRLQEEIIKKSNDLSIFARKPLPHRRKSAYIDLLATSPTSFCDCHDITDSGPGDHILSPTLFSLTNRGIEFTAIDLFVLKSRTSQEGPDYIMFLDCKDASDHTSKKYMLLKKIGVGTFVRAPVSRDWISISVPLERPWTMEKEIYILTKVTPDLYSVFDTSHRSSFEIRAARSQLSAFSIQGLEPCAAWDSPRSRFLTQGNSSFVGYVKIFPQLVSSSLSEFFVVTVSFRGQGKPHVCLVHPDVWVMYDAPGRTLAWTVNSAIDRQLELNRDGEPDYTELNLAQHRVTVAIHTRISRDVPVHKIIFDWKPHGKGKQKRA